MSNVTWSSLSYQAIAKPKTVPLTTRGILWRNKQGNEFYQFGGTIIGNTSSVNYYNSTVAPTDVIWKYSTELSTWSPGLTPPSTDWDLEYTSVPSLDKSFAYGSWSQGNTISSLMVQDNSQSPELASIKNGFNPPGIYEKGAMLHLPVQGGDGVLLFIGGSVTLATGAVSGNPDVSPSVLCAQGSWKMCVLLTRHLGRFLCLPFAYTILQATLGSTRRHPQMPQFSPMQGIISVQYWHLPVLTRLIYSFMVGISIM